MSVLTTALLLSTAAWPFAVVSDAVVAGIFSLVNTVLTALVLRVASRNAQKVDEVGRIVDRRDEQLVPPPDGTWKRDDDPPDEATAA